MKKKPASKLTVEEIYECLRGIIKQPHEKQANRCLMGAMAIVASQLERTCVHCGCTDSRACNGGCSWAATHAHTPTGICSQCWDRSE